MLDQNHYQVLVVGAGPTGLMLANLLGGLGVKTLIVERNPSTVSEPRAVSIDDEALRTAQAAGLVDDILPDVMLDYGSHYFSAAGQCFIKVEPTTREYGYPRRNAFRQPLLENTLRNGLDRFDHVDIRFATALTEFSQSRDLVSATLEPADGDRTLVTCEYLAACDGGRSSVRTDLDIPMLGSTFEQRWLIIDLVGTRDSFRHTRVFSNPARPGICLPGPHGTRRYEFMLSADETTKDAESEAFSRQLLRAFGPDGATDIVRRQVYTFHARQAERWREDRVFLVGDAAHLTPPFAGQGMNSGIRDAHNLAWKLADVVKGKADATLLETYQQERQPHAGALIELAMAIGRVMVPTSAANAFLKRSLFQVLGLWPPAKRYVTEMRFKPKPYYRQGFLAGATDQLGHRSIGRMLPQPLVETDTGNQQLLDQLLGDGFCALAFDNDPNRVGELFAGLPTNIAQICVTSKTTIPTAAAPVTCVRDTTGGFEKFVGGKSGMAASCPVFIVRPDRYIADAFEAATNGIVANRLKNLFNRKSSQYGAQMH